MRTYGSETAEPISPHAKANLRAVAARAGVSLATASRVANGLGGVRAETRDRVERAMRDLLYVPRHQPAPSGAIGLLLPELSNPIFPLLAEAMQVRAAAAGFATILCNTAGSTDRETEYVHTLLERRVAGMIFISSEVAHLTVDHSHYRRLVSEGARLVFVNGANETLPVPAVGVDEREAGYLATRHLTELGHERIGFVAGLWNYKPTRLKAMGRADALREAGLVDEPLLAHGDFSVAGGRKAAHELLASGRNRPSGVICSSDVMAIGVLHAAREAGLRVPDDLAVVGFDGIAATAWTEPQLTTIAQPIDELAETAVEALRTLIDEPRRQLPDFLFRPELVVRGSTASPSAT